MIPEEHARAVEAWRAARDERLRDADGWLTLIGLHWLEPGENRLGSAVDNDLVVRHADMPPHAGSLHLGKEGVELRRDGRPAEPMHADTTGEPTILEMGNLRALVIRRGERYGLRVRDHAAAALLDFRGMDHFPIDPEWRLVGRLEPASTGETLEIVDVTGAVTHEPTPGVVAFERDGASWRLSALPGGEDGSLWLVFADETSGRGTYGGGRFLYTEPVAADGSVVLDFNMAYNPPCVFTPYATCPLPPATNRLPLLIESGERDYPGD